MFEGLSDWDKGQFVYLSLLLIIVMMGAVSLRAQGLGQMLRMLFAWLVIFGILFIAAEHREDAMRLLDRAAGGIDPARGVQDGSEFRIRARADGHFWVRAEINDEPVLFLIDTGASDIVLTAETATRIGIDPASLHYDRAAMTANGPVQGATVRLDRISIGPIVRENMPASVTKGALGINLLGMQYLRSLSGWRVEGDTLILRS